MITIDPEFETLIQPLAPEEQATLRASIASVGRVLDPIRTWNGILVDGHHRYKIARELNVPYDVQEMDPKTFPSRASIIEFMIRHQGARRNLTQDQRLALQFKHQIDLQAFLPIQLKDYQKIADAGLLEDVIAGRYTRKGAYQKARIAFGEIDPPQRRKKHEMIARTLVAQRPPQGPSSDPHIPEGHELAGVSTLTGPDGQVRGRWDKTRVAGADAASIVIPDDFHPAKISVMKGADGTIRHHHETWERGEKEHIAHMLEAWKRHAELYADANLLIPRPGPGVCSTNLLNVIPLGDPHIGMLAWAPECGESFDIKIACRELLLCVQELLSSAPAAEQCIITNLGDFFHAQDDNARTPASGHVLSVDGRFAKVLDAGHVLLRGIVDAALAKHEKVKVRNLPGNHDPRVAAELMSWLRAWYRSESRVEVCDAYAVHQYDRFGRNLIGWHHGDASKQADLPAIMAHDHDGAEGHTGWWGETEFHVWHCGHIHHQTIKETAGCVVESHNTMAARDPHNQSRYRSRRRLQCITYHEQWGEHARAIVDLSRVRARLQEA